MNKCERMKLPVMRVSEAFLTDAIDTIIMRIGKNKTSTVPIKVDDVSITKIGNTAYNYSNVTDVVISEGIEVIE